MKYCRSEVQGKAQALPQLRFSTDPARSPSQTYSYTVISAAVPQTGGLFFNTPKAFTGYTLFAPKHYTAAPRLQAAAQRQRPVAGGRELDLLQ
jgi:hypothetical protein